jgi:hypothetical protein
MTLLHTANLPTGYHLLSEMEFFRKMPYEGGLPHGKIMTDGEQVSTECALTT